MRKNGKIIQCANCETDVYVPQYRLLRSKNHFCSTDCANSFQKRNKLKFVCKTCKEDFYISKSDAEKAEKRNHKKQYCSIHCRNNDKESMTKKAQKMNLAQLNKNGLNKLELIGREWLENLGFVLNIDFFEQVLLFEKFTVDVFIPKYNLVIQFDGEYWHNKPKRKQLDISQDAYLKKCGLNVFRITDREIKTKDINLFQVKTTELLSKLNPLISQQNISFKWAE